MENLPGPPDGISKAVDGNSFWISIYSEVRPLHQPQLHGFCYCCRSPGYFWVCSCFQVHVSALPRRQWVCPGLQCVGDTTGLHSGSHMGPTGLVGN